MGRYARRMGYPDEEGASLQPDSRPDAAPRPDPPWAQATGGGRHGQAAGPPMEAQDTETSPATRVNRAPGSRAAAPRRRPGRHLACLRGMRPAEAADTRPAQPADTSPAIRVATGMPPETPAATRKRQRLAAR